MKHIIAYIKPHKLDAVVQALHQIDELTGMTVLDVKGFGRGRKKSKTPDDQLIDFVTHLKIEIFCKNKVLDQIVSAIEQAAFTGLRGDGKIYICGVQEAIRISSGERGEAAV